MDRVFKLTPASVPASLDRVLLKRGYRRVAGASVQTVSLGGRAWPSESAVETSEAFSERWLSAYFELNEVELRMRETASKMLLNTVPRRVFASVSEGEKIVACGMGVAEGAHCGIFDIVTHPDHRRRGHARAVVLGPLRWGGAGRGGNGISPGGTEQRACQGALSGPGFLRGIPLLVHGQGASIVPQRPSWSL
ncbi:MAG: GNAT family N-acetyltransferase [Nitrososphaerota archaeon]|nr:GNAT family N-acetyltransferase [Nitrososphaerota archaeon]